MPVILRGLNGHFELILIESSRGVGALTFATLIDFSILAACLLRSSIFLLSDVICPNAKTSHLKQKVEAQQNVPPPFGARTAR